MDEEKPGAISPLVIVVVVVVLLGGTYLALTPVGGRHGPHRANEPMAITSLKAYLSAQNMFHRADHYGIGKKVYANPKDGVGFPDLWAVGGPGSGGTPLKLIDITFAEATPGGRTKAGYQFADITADSDGPYDPETECGLCAVPLKYNRSGRNIFVIDVNGTVYQKAAGTHYPHVRTGDAVPPVTVFPGPKELSTWIAVANE